MAQDGSAATNASPERMHGLIDDWSADKQTFHVPWGKAMMWIFLLSDTFIFTSFLTGYMNVRMSTAVRLAQPKRSLSH